MVHNHVKVYLWRVCILVWIWCCTLVVGMGTICRLCCTQIDRIRTIWVGCDIWWPDCKLSIFLGMEWFLALSQAAPTKLLGILGSSRTPWTISLWISWSAEMGLMGASKKGRDWVLPVLLWGPPLWGGVSFEWTPDLVCLPDQSVCGGMEFIHLVNSWLSGKGLFLPFKPNMSLLIHMEIFLIIFRAGNIEMTHLHIYYGSLNGNRWS